MFRSFLILTISFTATFSIAKSLSPKQYAPLKKYSAVSKERVEMRKGLYLYQGDTNKRFAEYLNLYGSGLSSLLSQVNSNHTQAGSMSKTYPTLNTGVIRSS